MYNMMNTPNEAISILVVDDDETCLSAISATLKKWNYEVVTAKHPFEALCTLRIKQGAFDLVVSDVHMPDINGIGLREIIKRDYNLPVVLMSVDEGLLATKGMENGSVYCIKKPICPNDLRDLWKFADTRKRRNELKLVTKPYSSKKALKEKGEEGTSDSINKAKVIWTNELHQRFLQAIDRIGFREAVPRKILEAMKVPGLTKAHVASHLQKYRLFLQRSLNENTNNNDNQSSDNRSSIDKTLLGSQSLFRNPSKQHQNSCEQLFHQTFLQHSPGVNTSFPSQETLSSTYLGTRSQSLRQNNYATNPSSLLSHQVRAPQAPQYPNNGISIFDTSIFCMRGQNRSDQNETYTNIGTSNISSTSKNFEPTNNYDCNYKSPDIGGIVQSSTKIDMLDPLDDDIIPWSSILDDDDRVQLSNFCSDEQIQESTPVNFLSSAPPSNLFSDEQIQETSTSFLLSVPPLLNNAVENEVQMLSIQTSINIGGNASTAFSDQVNVDQPQLKQMGGENLMNIFSLGMNEWQETPQVPMFEQTPSQNKGVGSNVVDHYQQGGTAVEPSNIHPSLEDLEDVEVLELLKTFRDCERDMSLPL